MKTTCILKSRHFIVMAMCFFSFTANAQLKVSPAGKVSVGTTNTPASVLSVNSAGNSNYAAYISGNTKVTNGFLNANVYNPTSYSGTGSSHLEQAFTALTKLIPMQYPSAANNLDSQGSDEDLDPINFPVNAHFAISATSLNNNFPLLVQQDENGNYIANYAELIPILVYAVKQLGEYICDLDPNCAGVLARNSSDENEEQQSMNRPRISQSLNDAILYQNTPNPFREKTEIRFHLPENTQNAYIYIFDMTGKTLKQLPVDTAMQSVTLAGYELSAGMYLYSLVINGQEIDTKRMILSK